MREKSDLILMDTECCVMNGAFRRQLQNNKLQFLAKIPIIAVKHMHSCPEVEKWEQVIEAGKRSGLRTLS